MVSSSLINCPVTGYAFFMNVIPIGIPTGGYCAQIIYSRIDVAPVIFVRIISRDGASIGSWKNVSIIS